MNARSRMTAAGLVLLVAAALLSACDDSGVTVPEGAQVFVAATPAALTVGRICSPDALERSCANALDCPVGSACVGAATQVVITAQVVEEEGQPLANASVFFSSDGGELASAGQPRLTDGNGIATDTLTVTAENVENESDGTTELTVTARAGAVSGTADVTVNVPICDPSRPVANAGVDRTGTLSGAFVDVALNGSASNDPQSGIIEWEWDCGNGEALLLGEQVTCRYEETGIFNVELTVTNGCGASTTDTTIVTIN